MPTFAWESRPRVKVRWRNVDGLLAAGCVLLLIGFLLPVAGGWGPLPEKIPSRFGADGKPSVWSPRGMIWVLPLAALLVDALMLWLARVPHLYNYPWPITPENAGSQYRMARVMMLIIANLVTAMFLFIYLGTWRVAVGLQPGLSGAFIIGAVAATMLTILGYLVLAHPRSRAEGTPGARSSRLQ